MYTHTHTCAHTHTHAHTHTKSNRFGNEVISFTLHTHGLQLPSLNSSYTSTLYPTCSTPVKMCKNLFASSPGGHGGTLRFFSAALLPSAPDAQSRLDMLAHSGLWTANIVQANQVYVPAVQPMLWRNRMQANWACSVHLQPELMALAELGKRFRACFQSQQSTLGAHTSVLIVHACITSSCPANWCPHSRRSGTSCSVVA